MASPGARLAALRRALWEEDRAWERVATALRRSAPGWWGLMADANAAFDAAQAERMEREAELWEAELWEAGAEAPARRRETQKRGGD